MRKWLLLGIAFLLLGSLAGDVLLVHQQLNSTSLDTEHSVQFVLALGLSIAIYFGTRINLFFSVLNTRRDRDSAACYFCGWHNSAYLEALAQ